MNYPINKILSSALILSLPLASLAQSRGATDTTFKSQSLNFYSTYKPEIAPAPKPTFVPSLPVVDTTTPKLNYQVPVQTISYSYKAEPIKPLALKRERAALPFSNYIKAGLGNQGTYLIDAGIGSLMGANYDATFHFNHLSQKGKFVAHQQWSQNTLNAAANFYFKKNTLNVSLEGDRRVYRQYGYNNEIYTFDDKDIKNAYSGLMAKLNLSPVGETFWDIKYKPAIRMYYWNGSMGATERNIDFSVPVKKDIDPNFAVSLAVNAGLTNYATSSNSFANNYFQLNPALEVDYEGFKAKVGIKPTWGTQVKYVLPDVYVSGKIVDNTIRLFAGWQGEFLQNCYRNLSLFNPYMNARYTPVQGRLSQAFGGFEATLGSHLSIGAKAGFKSWKNLALYQNDYTTSADGRGFKIAYHDMNAIFVDAKAEYQVNDNFSITGNGIWNFYDTKQVGLRAQQLPQIELHGGFAWKPFEKLRLGADLVYYDRIYVMKQTGLYEKLKPIVDLNLKVSYSFNRHFEAFVGINNLLNSRYVYWNQYNSLGATFVAGLKYKF